MENSSVSPTPREIPKAVPKLRNKKALVLVTVVLAVVALVIDQGTKRIVETNMYEGQVIDVWPPFLRWYYIRNSGAAFSMGESVTWIFTLIQGAVLLYVAIFLVRKIGSWRWALALGGLMGGVAGNLTDRLFRPPSFGHGHVVDFIALPNFAIFNVADIFIVCSMIGICLLLFTGHEVNGTRATHDKKAKSTSATNNEVPEQG